MTDIQQTVPVDLAQKVELHICREREQREPLALSYLTVIVVLALCAAMLWVEFENISLALGQLFPTLRDGSNGLDGTHLLAFSSAAVILCADVLMAAASSRWSDRTRRRVDLAGIVAVVLFAVGAMALLPASIWLGNNTTQDGGVVSKGTYLAFGLMLAALFPISLLANFVLIEKLNPALAKIVAGWRIDRRIKHARGLLDEREAIQAALREVEERQDHAPTDEQLAEEHAARAASVIEHVAGQLHQTILARTVGEGSVDAPLVATGEPLLDHLTVEQLKTWADRLAVFTPATIRQRILQKETL